MQPSMRGLCLLVACLAGLTVRASAQEGSLTIVPSVGMIVRAGDQVSVQCLLTAGSDIISPITILFNGSPLLPSSPPAGTRVLLDKGNSTVDIVSFSSSHSGEYSCLYLTFFRSITSPNVSVQLAVAPKLETETSVLVVNASQPWQLRCRASGVPPPDLELLLGTAAGPVMAREMHSTQLVVDGTFSSQAGAQMYTCRATNFVGTDSYSFSVLVQTPPRIVSTSPFNMLTAVRIGTGFSVSCDVTGTPRPSVVWMHNSSTVRETPGSLVVSSANLTTGAARSTLTVSHVVRNNSGIYTCRAHNMLGDVSATQTVVVQVAPGAPRSVSAAAVQQSTMTLSWSPPAFNGFSPIVHYVLAFVIGQDPLLPPLTNRVNGQTTSLDIAGLSANSMYTVGVRAVNAVGTGPPSVPLNVTTLPTVPPSPENVEVLRVDASSAVLNWTDPRIWLPEQGTLQHYSIVIQGHMTLPNIPVSERPFTVSGLVRASTFRISVRAHNRALGSALDAAVVVVSTPATAPSAPVWVDAVGTSRSSVNLIWQEPEDNGGLARIHYILTWSADPSDVKILRMAPEVSSRTVVDLDANTTYTVRLYAQNAAGRSVGVQVRVATLVENGDILQAPTPPQVLSRANETLLIAFPQLPLPTRATRWLIQYREGQNTAWTEVTSPISSSIACLRHLASQQTHKVRVALATGSERSFFSQVVTTSTLSSDILPDVAVARVLDTSISVRNPAVCGPSLPLLLEYRLLSSAVGQWKRLALGQRAAVTVSGLSAATGYGLRYVLLGAGGGVVASSFTMNVTTASSSNAASTSSSSSIIIAVAVTVPIVLILIAVLLVVVFAPRVKKVVHYQPSTLKLNNTWMHTSLREKQSQTSSGTQGSCDSTDARYPDAHKYNNTTDVDSSPEPRHVTFISPPRAAVANGSNYAELEFYRKDGGARQQQPADRQTSQYATIDAAATKRAHETRAEFQSTMPASHPAERTESLEHSVV